VVPADAVAPGEIEQPQAEEPKAEEQSPKDASAIADNEVMEVEFEEGHELIAFSEAFPELRQVLDERQKELEGESEEDKQARMNELRQKFNAIALKSRVKIGKQGGCIVFDSPELEALAEAHGVYSTTGHSEAFEYYGGILVCESLISESVAEQFVARWNAMAPPRKK